ncbi:MAG: heme exporter protein CcmB [Pseudomonadota bacterium]
MSAFTALIRRDVALALRLGGGGSVGVAFFVLVVVLVPLGVGPEFDALSSVAAGILWIAALLAALLSLDRLFQADFEDGSLDQLMLSPLALEQVVLAKVLAHWLTTGLPMVVIAPLLGASLGVPDAALWALTASFAVGTPALSLVGAIGAAITVGVRRGGLLLSVLVLPLYIPTLVFGAQVAQQALQGFDALSTLALNGVITLIAGAVAPFAAAYALRVNAG